MIKYDIYGKVVDYAYEIKIEGIYNPKAIYDTDCTAEDIFNYIKDIKMGGMAQVIEIEKGIEGKLYSKRPKFIGEKLVKTIEVDASIHTGDFIRHEGQDYEVVYVYNSDNNKNELFLDSLIAEHSENDELKNHVEKLCTELSLMIDGWNNGIFARERLKEEKRKRESVEKINKAEKKKDSFINSIIRKTMK